ncbi:DNA-binding MarR family transcriptional regulator [Streptomyces sp. SAI-126]|jgi:DNA-binding MarR family transcriptional regulator|uniref:MarR family winged helix-turn-helix transcriptional regulator n=1 Tax=unclassified Streptomyces TaxID=2593676 RepID=UPI000F4D2F16|nr:MULTISPECIES: MarR family winged helix-turn-helix transcriptional regulator [unclassified Streptomyces]QUC58189.1 MarR family transcriptional regulator [Streptomyces sp. A2-16]GLP69727.1 MarR family transcriptional regulator [Streptomyces sp. TUS-ST3]
MSDMDKPLPSDELGHRVSEVFDLVGALYRRGLRKLEQDEADRGMSVGVRSVLVLLHRYGPMTVPQMARIMALTRQFVQRMTNDAMDRGWTQTAPNPAHQRSSLIRITDEGVAVITAVLAREHALNQQVGGGELTGAELQACVRVLKEMLRTFDHVDVD